LNKENFEREGFNLVGRRGKLNQFERIAPPRIRLKGEAISGHRFGHAGSEDIVSRVLQSGQNFRTGRGESHSEPMLARSKSPVILRRP